MPSSCIAFFNDGARFDETLAAMDDCDFCYQLKAKKPSAVFLVDNDIPVRHLNEEKWNTGDKWKNARIQFKKKWGSSP